MMRFNMRLKGNSGTPKPVKVKVPKIEINECKGKTKDHKKLENEMLQQAKEAQLLLEQLLCEGTLETDWSVFRLFYCLFLTLWVTVGQLTDVFSLFL